MVTGNTVEGIANHMPDSGVCSVGYPQWGQYSSLQSEESKRLSSLPKFSHKLGSLQGVTTTTIARCVEAEVGCRVGGRMVGGWTGRWMLWTYAYVLCVWHMCKWTWVAGRYMYVCNCGVYMCGAYMCSWYLCIHSILWMHVYLVCASAEYIC